MSDLVVSIKSQLCQNGVGNFFDAFVEDGVWAVDKFFLRGGGWRKKEERDEGKGGS